MKISTEHQPLVGQVQTGHPSAYPLERVHYELSSASPQSASAYPSEKVGWHEPQGQPGPSMPIYPTGKPHFELVPPQQQSPSTYLPEKPTYQPQVHPGPPVQTYPNEKAQYEVQTQPIPPPPYTHTPPVPAPDTGMYAAPQVQCAYQTAAVPAPQPQPLVYKPPVKVKDEMKTGTAKRFLGDTLFGRVARSTVQSGINTIKLGTYLSPWGDNNSVTLPNVRYRDAILFGTFSVVGTPLLESTGDLLGGAVGDTFASTIIDPVIEFFVYNTVAKYALFQIIEQAIDKGILEHILPEEEKMIKTTAMRTLQCVVKHKLMDTDASIALFEKTPAENPLSCEKGWFCPYLFASNRTPKLARQEDFGVAQFLGPFLKGDKLLAEKLLAECAAVLGMCDADPKNDIGCKRMLVTFVGITPFRAGMWSTSRRPGNSTMNYHLLNGCPAFVIPVKENAPVVAWSPITLATVKTDSYNPAQHHHTICEFLDTVISLAHVPPKLAGMYEAVLARSVSLIINGVIGLRTAEREVLKKLDPERAGIAFFRY